MKFKKCIITFLLIFMVLFICIGSVSAFENQTGESADNEIIGVGESHNILNESIGSYSDLRTELDVSGDVNLTKNYYLYNDGDGDTIVITENRVINGNGAVIDMVGSTIRAFNVSASGVTIKNLTIKNANYNGDGGAIYFNSIGAVENCNFVNNSAPSKGGAIMFNLEGTVINCNFTDNKADYGGAIMFAYRDGTVTNCNFVNNTAYNYGGAIRFLNTGTVTNCSFTDNKADSYGGGAIFFSGDKAIVENCIFIRNSGDDGGSILSMQWLGVTADTCIFKTVSDEPYNTLILPPTLNVDNFTTVYGSGDKLTFDLRTNSSMPVTNGNISISVYFKNNNSWVGNYSCLSGEGWAVDLPVGSYYAIFDTEYAEFKPINRTITITIPSIQYYINVTSLVTNSTTVNITAESNIPKNIFWDGKLLFILSNGTEITANYNSNGTWWALHTFDDEGEYNVSASYSALDGVIINNATISIVLPLDITVTVETPVTYGDDAVINVEFNKAITRVVMLTVDANSQYVAIVDGKGVFNASRLTSGNHEVTVVFDGDEMFDRVENHTSFTVANAILNAEVYALNATVLQNISFVVNVPDSFKGNVSIKVGDNVLYNGTLKTLIVTPKLFAGDKTAVVVFYGDSNYNELTLDNVKFTVSRVTPSIDVVIDDVKYHDYAVATVNVENNANGTVNVTIGSKKFNATLSDGVVVIPIDGLSAGYKEAKVEFFSGDDYNNDATAFTEFVVNQASSDVSISYEYVYSYGDLISIGITTVNSTGNVNIYIDGKYEDLSLYDYPKPGYFEFYPSLGEGEHILNVYLDGDENYTESSRTVTFIVIKKDLTVNVSDIADAIVVGKAVNFTANLNESVTGYVIFTINGANYTVYVDNSDVATYEYTPVNNATINVFATFVGNEIYNGYVSLDKNFTVDRIPTTVEVHVNSPIGAGDDAFVEVYLNPNINAVVGLNVGTKFYEVAVVDGFGCYFVSNLAEGTYDIKTIFDGDDKYENSTSDVVQLHVNKVITNLSVSINVTSIVFGDNAALGIVLNQSINAVVTVKVNGSNHTVGLVNGKGSFTLSDLAVGTYYINAVFAGDDNYIQSTSNTVILNVTRISDYEITVSAVNITLGENETVIVVLPPGADNNNLVVEVDGTPYNHTMANGVATVIVPGLSGGEHVVNVTYNGDNTYDKLTVSNVKFTVLPVTPSIDVSIADITYPSSAIALINVSNKANGTVNITITSNSKFKTFNGTVYNGVARVELSGLSAGFKDVLIEFFSDDDSNGDATSSTRFIIYPNNSLITVDYKQKFNVGDDIEVEFKTINSTGDLKIYLNGDLYRQLAYDMGRIYVVDFSDLGEGSYFVSAHLEGDENYTGYDTGATINVFKNDLTITLNNITDSIYVGSLVNFTATLNETVTGDVIFNINGINYTAHVNNKNIAFYEYVPVDNSALTVFATFMGDREYNSNKSDSKVFDIKGIPTNISVALASPVSVGENAVVIINMNLSITAVVKLRVDDDTYDVALVDGTGTYAVFGLSGGSHELAVVFAGDDVYSGCDNATSFTVDKAALAANVTALNGTVEDYIQFVVDVLDGFEGNVSIEVDGVLYNGSVKSIIDVGMLAAGDYDATVVFYGDDNYDELTIENVKFTVSRVIPSIDVVVDDVTYSDIAVVVITVGNNANGTVNVTVGDNVFNGTVSNGACSVELANLSAGSKVANVEFFSDDDYNFNATGSAKFNVNKANSTVVIDVEKVYVYDEDILINLTVIGSDGAVNVTINGKVYPVNDDMQIVIEDIAAGEYTIIANLAGSENYTGAYNSTTFKVKKASTAVSIDVESVYKGGEDIVISLGDVDSKYLTVTINGEVYYVDDDNKITITDGLNAGDYIVNAILEENENYTGSRDTKTFKVIKDIVVIGVADITSSIVVGSPVNFTAELNESVTGDVIFNINGMNYTVHVMGDTVAVYQYTPVDNATLTVVASFVDNGKYGSAVSAPKEFGVEKIATDVNVTVNTPLTYGDVAVICVELNATINASVKLSVDGMEYYVALVMGKGMFNAFGLSGGNHEIAVVFAGDDAYSGCDNTASFIVDKATLIGDATVFNGTVEDYIQFVIDVLDDFEGNVSIEADGVLYNGSVKSIIDVGMLAAGDYDATVVFYGDDNYDDLTEHVKFTVSRVTPSIDVVIDDVAYPDNAVAVINIGNNANGTVNVTVDGKTFNGTVSNGACSVELANLSVGSKVATVEFFSSDDYNSNVVVSIDFNVNKANSTVVIDVEKVYVYNDCIIINLTATGSDGAVNVTINGKVYPVNADMQIVIEDIAAGEYTVIAKLAASENYAGAYNSTMFKVKKASTAVSIGVEPVYKGGEDIVISLGDVDSKYLTVTINGEVYYVDDDNKIIITDGFKAGDFIVNAILAENENYTGSNDTKSFKVVKKDLTIDLSDIVSPIYVDSPVNFTAELNETVTGDVIFNINDINYLVHVLNDTVATCVYVPDDDATLTVVASFAGNGEYNDNMSELKQFTVNKISTTLFIELDKTSMIVGDKAVVSVVLDPSITCVVTVKVKGKDYNVAVVNGMGDLTLTDLSKGTYVIDAIFAGDDIYMESTCGGLTLNVGEKTVTEMSVDVDVENGTVTIELPENATGNVTVFIDGKIHNMTDVGENPVVVEIGILNPGNYTIDVLYSGDDYFTSALSNNDIEIPKVSDYNITFEVSPECIDVTLPCDVDGVVLINVGDVGYYANVSGGQAKLYFDELPSGYYNITVTYMGDDKYAPKEVNDTVFIEGYTVIVDDLVKYYSGPEKLNVSIVDKNGNGVANKEVLITLNGITYLRITDSEGIASLNIALVPANYTVNVRVSEYNFSKNVTVEVKSTVFGNDIVKMFRNDTQYYALFLDGEGNPLSNATVKFNINGVFYTRVTNTTGWARMNINLGEGEYILTAINSATGEMISNNVTVLSLIESSDLTKYYRNDSQFVVRILNPDGSYAGAGVEVKFNINGVVYTRSTNATGHAMLSINLNQGNYTITTSYNNCIRGNIIKVLPILTADDVVMKYRDGSKFKARLVDSQGNAYPNQYVAFNINGVVYNRITDAFGEARLNINLVAGEYIITSSYNGCAISNKITITS